ncbi:2-dehydro-3-deoxyphosphogluconate aldolase/(4S)-4-hydroxy-2-oxoglutarate aldolase [Pseudarthrobacter sp. W1I19]|uniref:bifunctional 4-hydroxy-2-oxoglutarate aldolase/2-dehydro-3-deoxy-phosphogluconate aldolase n=1 Tax=Pseudarthrobacter sp. W1I19 TaxID=3042288 RepID=UPI002782409F|nr:bifunctional 4-hydroxy-2-oxoglutarate aldolase/2-dehydro-3-deoxy-phosphogluconate aldolase [Pseudarthrobacter sp. W1I19]MDQ0923875.1 2-dehydro-3-deoxyphosphogluconate aldolase/(4S)-4-hydroxy-2-oxoglutarate aldolase [Pseudarthrobacter sp. W1I19]
MSATLQRPAPSAVLTSTPIVAVLRAKHAKEYAPVIEALVKGGIRSIELTLSSAGVFDAMPDLLQAYGAEAELGIGTITTKAQARLALDSGAAFLVTPTTDPAIIITSTAANIPVYPGGLTPTELLTGWNAGATAVKIFPASVVGPGYIAQLRGPFPDLQIVPSGGVTLEDAPAWISAGALAVSMGGPLLQDAFLGGDPQQLTKRARDLTDTIRAATSARQPKGNEDRP